MKLHHNKNIVVTKIYAFLCWYALGTILGILGVLLSSHIPAIVLGWIFGFTGGLLHVIVFKRNLSKWIFGCIVSFIAGALTVIWAPQPIWPYAISCFFLFSVLAYTVLEMLLNSSKPRQADLS